MRNRNKKRYNTGWNRRLIAIFFFCFLMGMLYSGILFAQDEPIPLLDTFDTYDDFVPVAVKYFERGHYTRHRFILNKHFPPPPEDFNNLYDYAHSCSELYPYKALYCFTLYHMYNPTNMRVLKDIAGIFIQIGLPDVSERIYRNAFEEYLIQPEIIEGTDALYEMTRPFLLHDLENEDLQVILRKCLSSEEYFSFVKKHPVLGNRIERFFEETKLGENKQLLRRALWVLFKLKLPDSFFLVFLKIFLILLGVFIIIFIDAIFSVKRKRS